MTPAVGMPRRLTALDNAFLAIESPSAPMHLSCLAVYRRGPDDPSPTELIRAALTAAVPTTPALRRRLLPGMPSIQRGFWQPQDTVDVGAHLHTAVLAEPGGLAQLLRLAAKEHERHLTRARPLWEATVVTGLSGWDGEAFAVIFKIHHAAADGLTAMGLFAALHGRRPTREPGERPRSPAGEHTPSSVRGVLGQGLGSMIDPWRSAARVAQTLRARRSTEPKDALMVPWTGLNRSVSAARSVAATSFPGSDINLIRTLVPGSTANDVMLAAVGGAVRSMFLDQGAPTEDIYAAVPIVRTRRVGEKPGNDFDALRVPLGVHLVDLRERLRLIQHASNAGKTQGAPAALNDAAEMVPGWLLNLAVRASPALFRLGAGMPAVHTIVSNVAGPRFPLYLGPAQLLTLHALGPVANGLGVFHAITNYLGTVTVTVTSSPPVIPDLPGYVRRIEDAVADLAQAAAVSR